MGEAIARRQGGPHTLVLADYDAAALDARAGALADGGFAVRTEPVDVASADSVQALAQRASQLGEVVQLVHTVGLSPVQATVEQIVAVDVLGVAHSLDSFGAIIADRGSGVIISPAWPATCTHRCRPIRSQR